MAQITMLDVMARLPAVKRTGGLPSVLPSLVDRLRGDDPFARIRAGLLLLHLGKDAAPITSQIQELVDDTSLPQQDREDAAAILEAIRGQPESDEPPG